MGSDLWFYYYTQAQAEGCKDDDAARMADANTADHYATLIDQEREERRERAIRDIRRPVK